MYDFRLLIPLLLLSTIPSWSQTQPSSHSSTVEGNVYLGGAFTGSDPTASTSEGVGGGFDLGVYRWIGIQGDVSAYIASGSQADNTTTLVDYLFGPHVQRPLSRPSRISPFADALIGGQSFSNSSSQHSYYYANGSGLALAGDLGADFRLTRHFALRGQGGFVYSRFATPPTTTSNTRWRAGTYLVYRF